MVYKKVLSAADRQRVIKFSSAVACCWTNLKGAGDFDSNKADNLVEDFCDYLVGVKRVDGSIKKTNQNNLKPPKMERTKIDRAKIERRPMESLKVELRTPKE